MTQRSNVLQRWLLAAGVVTVFTAGWSVLAQGPAPAAQQPAAGQQPAQGGGRGARGGGAGAPAGAAQGRGGGGGVAVNDLPGQLAAGADFSPKPPQPVLRPEEEVKLIDLQPGFKLDLIMSDPE